MFTGNEMPSRLNIILNCFTSFETFHVFYLTESHNAQNIYTVTISPQKQQWKYENFSLSP